MADWLEERYGNHEENDDQQLTNDEADDELTLEGNH